MLVNVPDNPANGSHHLDEVGRHIPRRDMYPDWTCLYSGYVSILDMYPDWVCLDPGHEDMYLDWECLYLDMYLFWICLQTGYVLTLGMSVHRSVLAMIS